MIPRFYQGEDCGPFNRQFSLSAEGQRAREPSQISSMTCLVSENSKNNSNVSGAYNAQTFKSEENFANDGKKFNIRDDKTKSRFGCVSMVGRGDRDLLMSFDLPAYLFKRNLLIHLASSACLSSARRICLEYSAPCSSGVSVPDSE
jgi:hypothetical protein